MVPPQFISGVYLAPAVNYTCRLPDNQTHHTVVAEDSCSYIITNSSDDGPGVEELCTEWDFDTSVFSSTLTSEFSLVCEQGYLRATYQIMYMLGTFICPVIGGYLADRFGRYVVVVTQVIMLVTSLTVVFLNSFTAILAVRFISRFSNIITLYILAIEVCQPKHRAAVGILIGLPWALGTMAWAGAAFAIRDWRYLQLAVSLPILLIFPPLYFMDESPRWLIVRGRHDRALTILQKAARWNKATLPPISEMRNLMIDIQAESTENTRKTKDNNKVEAKKKKCRAVPVPNLLKNRAIATITTLVCLDYFVVSLVFDGLNMSGDIYSADPFLYLVLSGLVEVPGYSLTAPLIDRCGRKIPTVVSYLLCGVVMLALAFIPPDMSWLVMVLVLLGKLCISGAFQIITVYSSELFPTEVRLQGIGISSLFSQLGSTILPYITSVLFSLVCEQGYLRATYQIMYMLGTFICPVIGGYLADRFGRYVVVVTQVIMLVTSLTVVFLNSFTAILAVRFISGFSNIITLYILAIEVCQPKHRAAVGILIGLPWALGTMAWAGAAFAIRDWRYLQLAVSLPILLIFPPLYFMDESPRWLIVRGRHDRALTILQKAARWNKATLPPISEMRNLMIDIQAESTENTRKTKDNNKVEAKKKKCRAVPVPNLLKNRAIATITTLVCLDYFVVSLVFDGLNMSGDIYSADPFLYLVLSGLVEVPGYSLTAPLIDRCGRKIPTVVCYLLCGVVMLALAFIPPDMSWLVMVLVLLGKLCISGAFQIITVYSSELFPTEVRLQGIGISSLFSQLGSTILPYITSVLFSLVCEQGYLRATYQIMYMLGTFICPVIGGYLADRFGRYVVVVTQVIMLVTSLTVVFLNSFTAILAVRFISGFSNIITLYILAIEVCQPKHRAAVGILIGLPWALGTMAWAGAAFAIRDWRYLQLAVSLPILLIFPPLYFMDESPRWLIVRGRHDRALTILQKAARWNKATLPPISEMRNLMIDIQAESTENTRKTKDNNKVEAKKKKCRAVPVPNLLKNRAIATITTLVCLDYFVVSLVFDGLNMSGDIYSADPFLYLVLSGLVEVPGYSLTAPLIDRCGRKIPTVVCYLLRGVVMLALAFIPPDMSWLVMVLVLLGKLCISGAFQIITVYSSELFPTEVRLQGIGISSLFSQLGSTILPYITSVLFSLVCEQGYLRATYQIMYMLGTFICPVIGGYLADRFGRYVVVVTQVIMLVTSLTVVFLNSFTAILAVRFISGFSNIITLYILAIEVCQPKHRAAVGILIGLPWALGTMAWAGAAFAIRDWRYLQLAVSLPILLIFPPLYFMDESPRWLIVRGRHDRALTILQKAARWNKATLPPISEMRNLMIDIQAESTENTRKTKDNNKVEAKKKKCRAVPVPNLLKNRAIATITTLVCLDYFVVSLVFDGLNMSGDIYSADPFLYLVLSGLVEVPGYSLTAPLIDRCGRKIPTVVCYLLRGVVMLALAFIPPDMSWLVMVLVLLGKLCISGAFQIITVYSSELFPTEVRLQGIGISSLFSQLGSTILPYITSVLFSLVCEQGYLRATYQIMYMLGTFICPVIGGYLADRFGRYVVVVTQVIMLVTSLTVVFLNSFTAILAVRFISGFSNIITLYILAIEVCQPKHRAAVGILIGLPWALGTMAWAGAAFAIRDWRYLQLAVSLPILLIFPPLYFMDESPRWLIVRGRHDRALTILQKAARWNKATLPPISEMRNLMIDIQAESTENTRKTKDNNKVEAKKKKCRAVPVPNLLKNRAIATITTLVCLDYFVVSLVFDGLNMSGDIYSADPFLYLVLSGLVEVPGYSLTAPLIDRCGRKIPTVVCYLLCGVVMLALAFILPDMSWLVMVLVLLGKLCISGAFQIITVYSSELFPTEVRLQGIGISSLFSQLGSTILPYITSVLGEKVPWLPSVIFGCVSVIAGATTMILRETKGVPLPDTISDLITQSHQTYIRTTDNDVNAALEITTDKQVASPLFKSEQDRTNEDGDIRLDCIS
ncbi:hypothetical protein Pmani_008278 [Petrolisthes manimaculis]|uniref:Major facilitator superfamily (MFS) profile domain-containing protein n=1 Tax=Petrolisthes manimaculis TaxID=1843537 RepID=A0AAE1Q7F0_9EUCA|nr:hypothetical protein Pmani_008278 [Petrolisthes manimaculis]